MALLPGDILTNIFHGVTILDLGRCHKVCRDWNQFLIAPESELKFWRSYYWTRIGGSGVGGKQTWKGGVILLAEIWKNPKNPKSITRCCAQGLPFLLDSLLCENHFDLANPEVVAHLGYPLHLAASKGDHLSVGFLLAHGCDKELQWRNKTALDHVAAKANLEMLLLLNPALVVSSPQYLITSLKKKQRKTALDMIAAGIDVNWQDKGGLSPIHYASMHGTDG